MQPHRLLVPSLLVVALVGGSGVALHRHQVAADNARRIQTLAHDVVRPPGATVSTQCHGDGLVACWLTPATPKQAIALAKDQLTQAHATPVVSCNQLPSKAEPSGKADLCSAVVHIADGATTVFAFPFLSKGTSLTSPATLVTVLAS